VEKYFDFLRNVYFFKELSEDDIRRIQSVCHEENFDRGEIIFKEGSSADRFYIIMEGSVEVWKDYDSVERDLLAVHGKGKLFGEMALIDDLPRSATVVSRGKTHLLYIDRDDFHRIITENSSIAISIMKSVSLMVRKSNETFVEGLREKNKKLERAYRELKDTQEELIKAERLSALGKFSSLILHDIRNPLSILKGYAEMILLHPEDLERVKKSADRIVREANRLNALVNELLDFSRGEIRLNVSIVNLEEFIKGIVRDVFERFRSQGIEVVARVEYPGPVMLDVERMYRVLMNLADNSRKAMPNGGTFSIWVGKRDNSLVIEVSDTGIGMEEEVKKHIFEPFFSHSDAGGTGLGMAIVKSIVEAHKGNVTVESEKGRGTKFIVELPLFD